MPDPKKTRRKTSKSTTSENCNAGLSEKSRALVNVTEAQILKDADPLADKVWRMYAGGMSTRDIGAKIGRDHTWCWRLIVARTEELREITSKEHQAACRGVMIERYDMVFSRLLDLLDNFDPETCKGSSHQGLAAVLLKATELRGRVYEIGGEMSGAVLADTQRMEEVARRLALVGPHSQASRAASRSAMDLAGIKEADVRVIPPSTAT